MFGELYGKEEEVQKHTSIVHVPKAPEPRGQSRLVGLDNQGATCYLNSLLQAMYFTPEMRFGLFDIDPGELGAYLMDEYEQEKKENALKGIVEPDESMVEMLKSWGCEEPLARKALTAVKNQSVQDAFDYIESHESEMRLELANSNEQKKKKKKPRLIPLELQRLFVQMQLLDKKSLSTQGRYTS